MGILRDDESKRGGKKKKSTRGKWDVERDVILTYLGDTSRADGPLETPYQRTEEGVKRRTGSRISVDS